VIDLFLELIRLLSDFLKSVLKLAPRVAAKMFRDVKNKQMLNFAQFLCFYTFISLYLHPNRRFNRIATLDMSVE